MRHLLRAAALLVLWLAPAATTWAADHVLAISVSRYDPVLGVPSLPGVRQDRSNILAIAREFGFDETRTLHLQDERATLDGIRRELAGLADRVEAGDRVLVYYSGHGSTKQVAQTCQASLVTYEGEDYLSSELHAALQKLRSRQPSHLVVMIDACHSGEFTESARHKAMSGSDLQARMRPRRAGEQTCREPVNVAARALAAATPARPGKKATRRDDLVAGQWVMFSAARDNEVAWDGAKGGAATLATLACISNPELRSLEGNGFISADSLGRCVQAKLDAEQKEAMRQHVVVSGQVLTPLRPDRSSLAAQAPSSAMSTLEALARNGDPSWVTLVEPHVGPVRREDLQQPFRWATHNEIRIGSADRLQLSVQSNRAGYLYLVHASRESNRFSLLFPANGQDVQLAEPGKPLIIPRRWPAVGHNGAPEQDALLVIVSEQPMPDLHRHLHDTAGPATAQIAQQLAAVSTGKPCKLLGAGESTACPAGVPRKRLGDGEDTRGVPAPPRYGAALVLLDEVR